MAENAPPADIFKILVATDIHLGYEERDHIRGNDSFDTFEEILQIAQDTEVDLILLGGDLFHDTKPTSTCMHRCMALLRQFCMGDRPISFEILSDQEKNFATAMQKVVNYEDPNINVSLPVFSIHGNHDDPTGHDAICSLDILSCAGLVNFFGKGSDLNQVEVNPVLLQKGESRLAIFGFGHVRDCRLYRLFQSEKVTFLRPDEYTDEWFNIGVLHQNRAQNRGVKESIPEEFLPEFLDLVIWGHEHDCRIEPEFNPRKNFHVSQPGSSVATSLSEGESIPKKVGLLKVFKNEFQMEYIPLQTVRPFVYGELCASEYNFVKPLKHVGEQQAELAYDQVKKMIQEAKTQLTGHPKQPTLPLIRLAFFYSDEGQMFNSVHFGQKFEDEVANPGNMLKMRKRVHNVKEERDVLDTESLKKVLEGAREGNVRVEDYVKKYFQDIDGDESLSLGVLTATGLSEAVAAMVDSQNNDAIDLIIKHQVSRVKKHLITKDIDKDSIHDEIKNFNRQRKTAGDVETNENLALLEKSKTKANGSGSATKSTNDENEEVEQEEVDEIEDEDEDDEEVVVEPVVRGRGRGQARGSRAARAAKTPRAARGSRASSRAASRAASTSNTPSNRGRGRAPAQRTLQASFATQASQRSITKTSGRTRVQFVDSDDD